MLKAIHAVIGSAFGDEGKGQITVEVTDKLQREWMLGKDAIVGARLSGGCNAGHRAFIPGHVKPYVFSCLPVTYAMGHDVFLGREYIVNPKRLVRELEEIGTQFGLWAPPTVFVDPYARITLPWDILLNLVDSEDQYINSEEGKHGTCGVGILRTLRRDALFGLKVIDVIDFWQRETQDHSKAPQNFMDTIQTMIRDYYKPEIGKLGEAGQLVLAKPEFKGIFEPQAIEAVWQEIMNMLGRVKVLTPELLCSNYELMIVEGNQGLLLDQNFAAGHPHLTPTDTGLRMVSGFIKTLFKNGTGGIWAHLHDSFHVNVTYVSRPYVTRHGEGPLLHEETDPPFLKSVGVCLPDIQVDPNNRHNPHQGCMRYAPLNLNILLEAISDDIQCFEMDMRGQGYCIGVKPRASLAFTFSSLIEGAPGTPIMSFVFLKPTKIRAKLPNGEGSLLKSYHEANSYPFFDFFFPTGYSGIESFSNYLRGIAEDMGISLPRLWFFSLSKK